MSVNLLLGIVIGALVVVRVMGRQLRGSMVTQRSLVVVPLVLVVIGLASARGEFDTASAGELAFFVFDVAVLILIGFARGASTQLSTRDGGLHQKGTATTLTLWLLTIGIRVGAGFAGAAMGLNGSLTTAALLLTFGLSIAAQNVAVYLRAQRLRIPFAVERA
ncbi:hypothetical protein [Streptomyces sp. SID13031]|uniref:hypothetical protein n=1 Tax=Streptomyces sp. SID13031 TaxID=2706046 RepID=UPI0013C7ED14|nr:hypothetical protein [Streptomyces sp. SID13031]NEA31383.1 hypothetical protein [Streptomyces sp. SID13031]